MADRAGQGRSTSTSTRTAPRRSSPRSATASSGCCASSRSSRSSTARARTIGADEVDESCATSAERKVWTLADALVAGDRKTSIELLLELRQQGERVTGLIYNMVRRLRDAVAVADALQAGPVRAPRSRRRCGCRRAPRTSSSRTSRRATPESLRRALAAMADLEVETRGGAGGELSEDTAAVRAVCSPTR